MTLFLGILAICSFGFSQVLGATNKLSLAGTWRYQLDPTDVGVSQQWYGKILPNTLQLPGSLPEQGIGNDITLNTPWNAGFPASYREPKYDPYRTPGNIKIPFFLQPDKYYAAPAWYQREINIPQSWNGQEILLSLERPHWGTTVWVDGIPFGSCDSLSTAHPYDLGKLTPGTHTLSVRVDNRLIIPVGDNASSVTDHTQGDWNGIVGDMSLAAVNLVRFDDVQVYPHVASRSVTIKGSLANSDKRSGTGELSIKIADRIQSGRPEILITNSISWNASNGNFVLEAPLGADAPVWDEFTPALLELTMSLSDGTGMIDSRQIAFGLREVTVQGRQFLLNGHKAFFRGTIESCVFPNSGHPPTDTDSWRRIIRIAKSYGLNHIRFHTWCPPEAAFEVADELGFYYQVECASWAFPGSGTSLDAWLYVEAERILKSYGNHPSLLLMASGNEPVSGFDLAVDYLNNWIDHFKAEDARRLFVGTSGYPEAIKDQFHVTWQPRITILGLTIYSYLNSQPPQTVVDFRGYINSRPIPSISHEIGQWTSYPNIDAISKYTNYLKPKFLEIFRDFLAKHQMVDLVPRFVQESGKLQVLCYKEEIEVALRTPGMGGFHLLGLTDYPGQGAPPIGVLDAFWDEKGYVTAAEYSRFCNSTVPLVRLQKRVFSDAETLDADAEVAHFGAAPLTNVIPTWSLIADDGSHVASGTLPAQTIPVGNGINLGSLHIELAGIPSPARYKLELGLAETRFTNDWDVWIYPSQLPAEPEEKPISTDVITPAILDKLTNGAKVLLNLPVLQPGDISTGRVTMGFSTIFWDTAWFNLPPTSLGILCDPSHPLFKYFPTDSYSNWQWWYLLTHTEALVLDDLPPELDPPVRVIDDWLSARRLGMLFEAKFGQGKLLVCSIDLRPESATNLVSRQFRHSLLNYMASSDFAPATEITVDALAKSGLRILSEPPSFIESPQNALRAPNYAVSFSAVVNGTPPIEYSWFHDGIQVTSGTSSDRNISMTISNLTAADAGFYTLRVTNPYRTLESPPVSLTVLDPAPGTFLEAVINRNPIAYWRFDDKVGEFAGALDLAGGYYLSHTNVTASLGPAPPDFFGFPATNVAGSYNGFNSGSQATKFSIKSLPAFTICGWINPSTIPQPLRAALFGQNDFAELGFHYLSDSSRDALAVWVAGPVFTNGAYGTLAALTNSDAVLIPGKWYFVAVTADSSSISLYLNGAVVARTPGAVQNIYNPTSPFQVGFGALDGVGDNFNGMLDEIVVFDRALSPSDISSLYSTAVGFAAPPALHVRQINGQAILDWTSGSLQSSDSILGTFVNVPAATSPYTNSIIDQSRFFRLQLTY